MNATLRAEFLKLRNTKTAAGLAGLAGRRAGALSLGERQRLGLAAALLGDPEVLILDEPGNGLDPAGVAWLRDLLRQLAGEGRTVLVSSHLLAEVAQTAGQVIVIDHGRLISSGPVSQLTAATGQAVVVRAPRAAELREALVAGGAAVRELADGRLEITGAGTEQVATVAAARGLPIFEISEQAGSLEEAFLALTAAERRPG